jgi:hypothetical protein
MGESPDDHSSGDHGEVGRQRALAPEAAKDGKIFVEKGQKDFGNQIISGFRSDLDIPGFRSEVDDVDDQSEKPVREITPRIGIAGQAFVEEDSIEVGECHWGSLESMKRIRGITTEERFSFNIRCGGDRQQADSRFLDTCYAPAYHAIPSLNA